MRDQNSKNQVLISSYKIDSFKLSSNEKVQVSLSKYKEKKRKKSLVQINYNNESFGNLQSTKMEDYNNVQIEEE